MWAKEGPITPAFNEQINDGHIVIHVNKRYVLPTVTTEANAHPQIPQLLVFAHRHSIPRFQFKKVDEIRATMEGENKWMMDVPDDFIPEEKKVICSGLMSPTKPGAPPAGADWKKQRNLWSFRDEIIQGQVKEANKTITSILLSPGEVKDGLNRTELRTTAPIEPPGKMKSRPMWRYYGRGITHVEPQHRILPSLSYLSSLSLSPFRYCNKDIYAIKMQYWEYLR